MRSLLARSSTLFAGSTLLLAVACGSTAESPFPNDPGASSSGGDDNSSGGFDNSSSSSGSSGQPPCVGLQCNQEQCAGGGTTTLTGKVYLPEGTIPLYNAIVYVPNAPIAPFQPGITCDQCGTIQSGSPIATAITDATGSFELKNVPVGVDVPLVIQIGRWRRQVTVPASNVTRCGSAAIGAAVTRLPRNKTEGDIPKIAITTGDADSLECFLRKLGVEDSEITIPSGTGRVHMYRGNGAQLPNTPAATDLWNNEATLKEYDMVVLSCEGGENNNTKTEAARANMRAYLDGGGRVFASHFHYTWFKNPGGGATTNPYNPTATWVPNAYASPQNHDVTIDTSFAKGQDFSTWMDAVGATTAPRSNLVSMTELRRNVMTVPDGMSRRWLHSPDNRTPPPAGAVAGQQYTKFLTFNTPLNVPLASQCGRAVYTDIHVSSGDTSSGTFPNNCTTSGFTSQEKALLFLLMDLAACIQDDNLPPVVPPPSGPR